jgi:hypothetical protein
LLNRKDIAQQRNPFLPLPDASFSTFSSLTVPNDPYNEAPASAPAHGPDQFQLNPSYSLPPQAGLIPPTAEGPPARNVARKPVPAPLQLDEPVTPGTPKTGRKLKFGLPTNPRPRGA